MPSFRVETGCQHCLPKLMVETGGLEPPGHEACTAESREPAAPKTKNAGFPQCEMLEVKPLT